MFTSPMRVWHWRTSASTASAELMNGCMSSIFMLFTGSGGGRDCDIVAEDVTNHLIQHLGLDRLLDEVARALLERGDHVLLIADRRDHDDSGFGMLAHDALNRLDAFHLWHGDVHEDDVGLGALVFGNGGAAVAGFSGKLSTKRLEQLHDVFPREYRVVNHQVSNGFLIFTANQSGKLLHNKSPYCFSLKSPYYSAWNYEVTSAACARRSGAHCAINVFANASSGTTRMMWPRSMAAFGIPKTIQDCSSCASVIPPAAFTAPMASAPSSPIPVMMRAREFDPHSSATERKRTSTEGRCPLTCGSSESTTIEPRGARRKRMWRFPGQIRTRPAVTRSPERASLTSIEQHSFMRRANISVNPSGICCTTRMAPGKSEGNCDKTYCSALGPPVEIPIATIFVGAEPIRGEDFFTRMTPDWNVPAGATYLGTPVSAATFTLLMSSREMASRLACAASRGLATKSKAPSASALKVAEAPAVL